MQSTHYSRTAILLHWSVALLIVAAFAIGIATVNLGMSPTRLKLINWHKWVGICVLGLMFARLTWRIFHAPPEHVSGPRWQQQAASVAHVGLYMLCFAMPLLGWAYSSAAGFPVVVFGLIPLPNLVGTDRELAAVLKDAHRLTSYVLGGLILAHVGAAFKHHFITRNGLLKRMSLRHLWSQTK